MHFQARRYDTGEAVRIEIDGQRLAMVSPASHKSDLPWVGPGLVDIQVNGFGGYGFTDPALSVERVARISQSLDAFGTTRYCPTTTTHSHNVLAHALRTIASACEQVADVARRVAGIHVEGPYISPQDGPRGAHPVEYCRPPDWDEFCRLQEAAGGRIRLVTMSPEYEGSEAFIRKVVDGGVLVAIGHTQADTEQIQAAVDAGARLSTHLGNGAHGQLRRHPNYIWDQLADDRLQASLIIDGHHLPPSVVKCFLRAKAPQRCLLISDLVALAGMPPGSYDDASMGAVEVLEGGRLVVAGQQQYLAGASLPITLGVANAMRFAGLAVRDAWEMASQRPAELLGIPVGRFEPGAPADLVLFKPPIRDTDPMHIETTINSGEVVFGALP